MDALVRALPEKLKIITTYCGADWNDTLKPVTEHEWLTVVRMVEGKLAEIQQAKYAAALGRGYDGSFLHVTASWPARAQALADIGAITIEGQL